VGSTKNMKKKKKKHVANILLTCVYKDKG